MTKARRVIYDSFSINQTLEGSYYTRTCDKLKRPSSFVDFSSQITRALTYYFHIKSSLLSNVEMTFDIVEFPRPRPQAGVNWEVWLLNPTSGRPIQHEFIPNCFLNEVQHYIKFSPTHLNFHPLEVVSRYRDPQLQVGGSFWYLFTLWPNICKSRCLNTHFAPNNCDLNG